MKWKIQIIVICALIGFIGLAIYRSSHKRQIAQMNATIEAQIKELDSLHKQLKSTQAEIKSISDYCRRVKEIKINYSETRHEIDEANENSEVNAWSGVAIPDALCRVLNERLCIHTHAKN